MSEGSNYVAEIVSNVIALIFILALDYCFFWEDDAEAVSQSYIEAALEGDGAAMAELSTKFMPYLGRLNYTIDHPRQRDMWDGLMKATDRDKLNSSLQQSQQRIAYRFKRRVKASGGWDEVEIISLGIKELSADELSLWSWVGSLFEDRPWSWIVGFLGDGTAEPEYREDKVGMALIKVIYDDGSLDYSVLTLTHVDSSEYTIEGWTVTRVLGTSMVAANYDVDDIKAREKRLVKLVHRFGQAD